MSNTGFTPVNISVALVISGLLHLLLFYLPDDLPVDQDPSGQQAGRIEIELMKSAPQASSSQSEKSMERAGDARVNMGADILAADVESPKPDRHAGQSSSLGTSPEPVALQDVETVSKPLSANLADRSSSASKNDPSHLLKLIYTEINKHKQEENDKEC